LWDRRTGRRASFATDFSFAIGVSQTHDRGDGMAFFIGASRLALPPDATGAFLGLLSNTTDGGPPPLPTVGVEFDTCYSEGLDPPGVIDHIGVDVNNITSVVYKSLGNDFPNPLSGTMSASVKYDGSSMVLSVSLQLANGAVHDLETLVDLKAEGVPQVALA
jgi:hypothetical protein